MVPGMPCPPVTLTAVATQVTLTPALDPAPALNPTLTLPLPSRDADRRGDTGQTLPVPSLTLTLWP